MLSYCSLSGQPFQVPPPPPHSPSQSWGSERVGKLLLISSELQGPFDLGQGPLLLLASGSQFSPKRPFPLPARHHHHHHPVGTLHQPWKLWLWSQAVLGFFLLLVILWLCCQLIQTSISLSFKWTHVWKNGWEVLTRKGFIPASSRDR